MRITDIVTTAVRVPFKERVKWSGGTRETAPAIILQIFTDEGVVGLGECVGPTLPPLETIIQTEFRQFLVGQDALRIEYLLHRMEEYARNWSQIATYAIAGIEMALWDIKGKALGAPIYELLGGAYNTTVPYMGYLFIDDPEANAKRAAAYVAQGHKELKLKCGRSLQQDVDTLAALRAAVGTDIKIRVDANMNWSVPTAIKWIKAMQPYDIQWVEQPVPDWDLEGMAQVRRAVDVPIAADEACTTVWSALQLLKHEACDVFVVYVSEAGGLIHSRQIAALADAAGKWCAMGTWAELGIATAAGAHAIAATRTFAFANDTHYPLYRDDVITPTLNLEQGCIRLNRAPGLGVTLDPERLATYHAYQGRDSVFYDDPLGVETPRVGQIL